MGGAVPGSKRHASMTREWLSVSDAAAVRAGEFGLDNV